MALVLSEEQLMLREAARDFLSSRATPRHLRELRDSGDTTGFSRELWAEMAELGWPAVCIPQSWDGLEYGCTGMGILLEECGRNLASSPLLGTALMGVTALAESGNEELCEAWLPAVAAGGRLLAIACDERARHRPESVSLAATPAGDGFILDGEKTAVGDGHVTDGLIVSARSSGQAGDPDGISLFLVDGTAEGVQRERIALLDNHGAARVRFRQVRVGASRLLGAAGAGGPLLESVLDAGRAGAAAELLGIARESFERTVQYLKERKQFGVPIGSFQALQHRAAVLFGEIELCKSVVLRALQAVDERHPQRPLLVSLAKARAGATAKLATAEAIQMHGGIGMTDELDIGFFIKRYQALDQALGDSAYHTERFARLRGY